MIIIGELINATRESIANAIEERDENFIQELTTAQVEGGASYIDINAGRGLSLEDEIVDMYWLITAVQEVTDVPLSIDSSSLQVIKETLNAYGNGDVIINSTDATDKKLNEILPLLNEYEDAKLIALPVGEDGIPHDSDGRIELIEKIYRNAIDLSISPDRLFFDPLVLPISINNSNALTTIKTLRKIKSEYPNAKTTIGLSNISYGLPERNLINTSFMTMAVYEGVDSLICGPTNEQLMLNVKASEAVAGRDRSCRNFMRSVRGSRCVKVS
jgi:5-methyltetrahydrofolate corrinoid/iron sulfur protein methyltransferase